MSSQATSAFSCPDQWSKTLIWQITERLSPPSPRGDAGTAPNSAEPWAVRHKSAKNYQIWAPTGCPFLSRNHHYRSFPVSNCNLAHILNASPCVSNHDLAKN